MSWHKVLLTFVTVPKVSPMSWHLTPMSYKSPVEIYIPCNDKSLFCINLSRHSALPILLLVIPWAWGKII